MSIYFSQNRNNSLLDKTEELVYNNIQDKKFLIYHTAGE